MKEFSGSGASYYDHYDQGVEGDLAFYVEEAMSCGSPVLELGCGTGRILLPLAEAGLQVVGLDCSADMLHIARNKIDAAPQEVQERITLLEDRMESFQLEQKFKAVLIPHRAFMHLLEPPLQAAALRNIHSHLEPGGHLVFNIVTPAVEEIAANTGQTAGLMQISDPFINPDTGNQVMTWTSRRYDPVRQHVEQYYLFDEIDAYGDLVRRAYTPLYARYTHRYEMQHLLNLCGFRTVALYGDFTRRAFRNEYHEQIWVVTPATTTS
ncbi:MAG: class I SAM-dependent methyltransferase [Deltaproteobacteria bacterium]|nr:MAG: class I SAM-dependent methyltransferase [Deltaproteobacteria bacterium]